MTNHDSVTRVVNRPVKFAGSEQEMLANRASHFWVNFDGEVVCSDCDHKIWHVGASYPCGVEPPRESVEVDVTDITQLHQGLGA
jgi:hypothetical protein